MPYGTDTAIALKCNSRTYLCMSVPMSACHCLQARSNGTARCYNQPGPDMSPLSELISLTPGLHSVRVEYSSGPGCGPRGQQLLRRPLQLRVPGHTAAAIQHAAACAAFAAARHTYDSHGCALSSHCWTHSPDRWTHSPHCRSHSTYRWTHSTNSWTHSSHCWTHSSDGCSICTHGLADDSCIAPRHP
jgi:hypothetical protein